MRSSVRQDTARSACRTGPSLVLHRGCYFPFPGTNAGTNGHPDTSNVYNYSSCGSRYSAATCSCAILEPQPPDMPCCMEGRAHGQPCDGVPRLSNTFGTLSMSTAYKKTAAFPDGVTWNATAELFINIGHNNTHLDANLFAPICTISKRGMETVLSFPSFGEVREFGGEGVSLGLLYELGNAYIRANTSWAKMAKTSSLNLRNLSTSSRSAARV